MPQPKLTASALVFFIVLLGLAASANADITINSSFASVQASATFDVNDDGAHQPNETVSDGPITGTAASYNHTASATIGDADAQTAGQSSVVADVANLTVTAHGDCSGRAALTGDHDKDLRRAAGGQETITVDFTVSKLSTFTISGAVGVAPQPPSAVGGGDNRAILSFGGSGGTFVDIAADDAFTDPANDSTAVTGQLTPGEYSVSAQCQSFGPRQIAGVFDAPAGDGHFSFTLTVAEARCTGPTSTWVGPASGAFDDPQNWDPPIVPTFGNTDDDCDEALFDRGRTIDVDLSAPAAALAPRTVASRTAGRLHVRKVKDLRLIGEGLLIVDGQAEDRASLIVDGGGRLHLADGSFQAQNARVGVSGNGSVLVETATSLFTTLRTLTLGSGADGLLNIRNAGVGQSAEVRIGDRGGHGLADIDNGTWTTADISVGFGGRGELLVENGGEVDSTNAVVDAGLPPAPAPKAGKAPNLCIGRSGGAGVDVRGRGATSSAWHVDTLAIGGLGCVEVTDEGGIVTGEHAGGDVLVGTTEAGEGLLFVNQGGVLSVGGQLVVGENGPGKLVVVEDISSDPRVNVTGALVIGESLPPAGSGKVVVDGDILTDGASLSSNTLRVPDGDTARGDLEIRSGGRITTATTAEVGAEGTEGPSGTPKGFGIVLLNGLVGEDPSFTRWQIGTSLTIGGTQVGSSTGQLDISDASVLVGTAAPSPVVTINPGGRVTGFGHSNFLLTVGGTIHNDGVVSGPVVLGGSYDASSHGSLVQAFGANPIIVPTLVIGDGPRAAKPPPLAQGPIVITGDADLSNTTIVLQFVNGFAPHQGDAFPIFEVQGELAGTFPSVEIQGLAPGAAFDLLTTPGMVTSLTDAVALPVVSLKAPKKLKESAKKGVKVQLKRTGATTDPLTVHYRVRGSAENGIDYVELPGTLEIPATKKSATLVVQPFADGVPEPPETIQLEVLPGDDYAPSVPSTATITLVSVDKKPK